MTPSACRSTLASTGRVTTPAWVPAGTGVVLRLGPAERTGPVFDLHPETEACTLAVQPAGGAPYALPLMREDRAVPALARIDTPGPACTLDPGGDALARVFAGHDAPALSMGCPVPLGAYRLLPDGIDAMAARIEALTGRLPDRATLMRGDPQMALDWSQAPVLDLIYVTTLNLNADFAGYLTARMLAWHAARGTVVRILASDVMLTDTDRALVEGLAARYPSVQVQAYQFPASAARGVEGQLGRFHRVNHVKLFAAIAREPGRSRAITGGRNIHEGYYFDEPRDLSALPFLHQYDVTQTRLTGGFTAYDDNEIVLSDDAAVRAVVGHMAALWHRDTDTQRPRPLLGERRAPVVEGTMRPFVSVPAADGQALESLFVAMIDAAQQRIRIASPYLTLTPALDAALGRARARGVAVDIVLTVRVREALDFAVTGYNRRFINRFGDWARVFDHDLFPALLHAKFYVIDDRLVVITSTNLNARSFVHDTENGIIALDAGLARAVDAQIASYIAAGERVLPGQPVPGILRWFERLPMIERAF